MELSEYKLTQYAHGAGCGCKIAPQTLEEILKSNKPQIDFPNLLVGNKSNDDAAVYQTTDKEAIIATTDFFTPIVDDAYVFGQIAAANAISDVYAMGGEPIMALAILGWPIETLPTALAQQVLEGARAICSQVNIPLAGGHSIDSREPIFGLSVNGRVALTDLKQNNTAQTGDVLFLTKPIGVGILATASKRNLIEAEDLDFLYRQLTTVNSLGGQLGKLSYVHAMTDITGFGLAGHLIEMAEGSNLTAVLEYAHVKKVQNIQKYLSQNTTPDATYRNWNAYEKQIQIAPSVDMMEAFKLLPDPQTNGGLLFAVAKDKQREIQSLLQENNLADFILPIGEMVEKTEKALIVK